MRGPRRIFTITPSMSDVGENLAAQHAEDELPSPVAGTPESAAAVSSEPKSKTPADDCGAYLSVVMCPPDGGVWPVFTCMLGAAAAIILDGVCSSLFLYDGRVGMAEQVSSSMPALEHLAVIYTFRYLAGKCWRSSATARYIILPVPTILSMWTNKIIPASSAPVCRTRQGSRSYTRTRIPGVHVI